MSKMQYRGYVIEKRRKWLNNSTLGYNVWGENTIRDEKFNSLQDAQEYIRSITKVVVVGGE